MNRSKAAAGLRAGACLLLLALVAGAPAIAQAQGVNTGQPVAVKPAAKIKKKFDKFSGKILSVNQQTIKVRGDGNYDVRDFAYTRKVSEKVARGMADGRYASGQPVEIKYIAGSDVATGIRR